MWTIFNSEGKAVANCDFEPNHDDLLTRGEQACFHDDPIALPDAILTDGAVQRKPSVTLAAKVVDCMAAVTVACEDASIKVISLTITDVVVTKPVGTFFIHGEPGIKLYIDFDRDKLRGDGLEVCF